MAGFSAGKNLENNVNVAEAQTLSNKTLDNTNAVNGAPIQDSTITNASIVSPDKLQMKSYADLATAQADLTNRSGGELVYVADIKKTYQVNDDGLGTKTLAEISGGQGGVNYIENSDFEQGVDGYVESGLNFTIDQTKVAGEVLRGEASAKLSKLAVDATGAEISVPFTVSRADLAKKLTISFEYDASDAAYADDDIQVYVKQDPNGTPIVIRINGEDLKGGKGTHYAQFQTDASQTEYELVFKVNSANASAYDVIIDDVKVGPRELAKGTIVTDWEEFDALWLGNTVNPTIGNGSLDAKYKRVGDSAEIRININIGSTTNVGSGIFEFDISNIGNIDLIKAPVDLSIEGGLFYYNQSSSLSSASAAVYVFTSTKVRAYKYGAGIYGSPTQSYGTGDRISLKFTVPIQGWSSNTVMSEDLGGRDIIFSGNSNIAALNTNGVEVLVDYSTKTIDTVNAFDLSTNRYNIIESGYYNISLIGTFTNLGLSDNGTIQVKLKRNGSIIATAYQNTDSTNAQFKTVSLSRNLFFNKGDYLELYGFKNNAGNASVRVAFDVHKIPSPQTILETETVAAKYQDSNGQQYDNNVTTTFTPSELLFDTHNAFNTTTGEFTVPSSGFYLVSGVITLSGLTINNGNVITFVLKNEAAEKLHEYAVGNRTTEGYYVNEVIKAEKGDKVKIGMKQINGANRNAIASSDYNVFEIIRIK